MHARTQVRTHVRMRTQHVQTLHNLLYLSEVGRECDPRAETTTSITRRWRGRVNSLSGPVRRIKVRRTQDQPTFIGVRQTTICLLIQQLVKPLKIDIRVYWGYNY